MKQKKLYIVSDWKSYTVAEAVDHYAAIERAYSSKSYRLIPTQELTENTVTHAMCCEYTNANMLEFNNCIDETGIVLLMNEMPNTFHFQLSDDFFA